MNRPVRLMCVFGTRPEAIKVAPIVMAARYRSDVEVIACSTGQHKQMLDQVNDYFGIRPDVDLALMQPGQSLTGLASRCLSGLQRAIGDHQPDWILGQGDTTTAMCASMAAFFEQLPFVHVEAGLRTDDIRSPFPEEFNRRVCSLATTLHCAPTTAAARNLLAEGYRQDSVHVTGNTVIDALNHAVERERVDSLKWIEKHPELAEGRVVLITAHRRENHGDGIRSLCRAIRTLAGKFPTVRFVYPVHLNPQIRGPVHELLSELPNVHLIPPADYPEFVWLMDQATLIVSDSGGVQEEAPTLGKPVLVTRNSTERPEALDAGATRLIGTDETRVVEETSRLLLDKDAYAAMQVDANPYGDGRASKRILDLVVGSHGTAPLIPEAMPEVNTP
ncbi:MAG: UDP-N-acetylglucosamine 2-epimerase (non-hydrolyzing) [Planctomycetaceae bacterium]|nr:UDP-N-acetylglucosamine 2-epimerase (non-hydrolyzing) [Planctomycetaceae bacterium]